MKIYLIIHSYDVDGGFGDAVSKEEILFATSNKEDAEEYRRKYNDPCIYESSYEDLYSNEISVREMELYENLPTTILPPENSFYNTGKIFTPGTKEYEEYWRKKRRENEVEEMKAACESAGCTFTPAY